MTLPTTIVKDSEDIKVRRARTNSPMVVREQKTDVERGSVERTAFDATVNVIPRHCGSERGEGKKVSQQLKTNNHKKPRGAR